MRRHGRHTLGHGRHTLRRHGGHRRHRRHTFRYGRRDKFTYGSGRQFGCAEHGIRVAVNANDDGRFPAGGLFGGHRLACVPASERVAFLVKYGLSVCHIDDRELFALFVFRHKDPHLFVASVKVRQFETYQFCWNGFLLKEHYVLPPAMNL